MTDAGAFTALLAEHGPALVLYARNWAPDQATAEDIVQEAVVRCWRADPGLARGGPAYVYVAVRNEALNRQRSWWRRQRWWRTAAGDPTTEFTCPFADGERREILDRALRRLPEAQREVVHLHLWGGLSFADIAAALDCSPNTVASRYRYALTALRGWLPSEDRP